MATSTLLTQTSISAQTLTPELAAARKAFLAGYKKGWDESAQGDIEWNFPGRSPRGWGYRAGWDDLVRNPELAWQNYLSTQAR